MVRFERIRDLGDDLWQQEHLAKKFKFGGLD